MTACALNGRCIPFVNVDVHLLYAWAKSNVFSDCHVLEERIALEDKADAALFCRQFSCILTCVTACLDMNYGTGRQCIGFRERVQIQDAKGEQKMTRQLPVLYHI